MDWQPFLNNFSLLIDFYLDIDIIHCNFIKVKSLKYKKVFGFFVLGNYDGQEKN